MLVISDLHWRCDTPSWRKEENYSKQVLRPQLGALLDVPVIVAGDVFHRAADMEATYDLLAFLQEKNAVLYAVRGQHDMVHHNDGNEATGFNVLVRAGRIVPLGKRPTLIEGAAVCGMSWGETSSDCAQILIAHVSISYGDAVIPGATSAQAWRLTNEIRGFPLVFTGDNHKRFCIRTEGLFNAGCFHQMTSDLADQEPAAWHVMPNGEVTLFPIPFTPPMVDESYMLGQKKGKTVAGAEFVKALTEARNQGGGDIFIQTLEAALSEAEGGIKTLLGEVLQKCKEAHT